LSAFVVVLLTLGHNKGPQRPWRCSKRPHGECRELWRTAYRHGMSAATTFSVYIFICVFSTWFCNFVAGHYGTNAELRHRRVGRAA